MQPYACIARRFFWDGSYNVHVGEKAHLSLPFLLLLLVFVSRMDIGDLNFSNMVSLAWDLAVLFLSGQIDTLRNAHRNLHS